MGQIGVLTPEQIKVGLLFFVVPLVGFGILNALWSRCITWFATILVAVIVFSFAVQEGKNGAWINFCTISGILVGGLVGAVLHRIFFKKAPVAR
jgi:hypothetical protein